VQDFDGIVPSDPKILEKQVDGVGPYTAGAIASIAYNKRVAAVDGNVQRVYARVFAIHANPSAKATTNHLQRLAEELVPASRPGDYNVRLL
jgi:A/G-specific adenine glycosylase